MSSAGFQFTSVKQLNDIMKCKFSVLLLVYVLSRSTQI